MEELPHLQIARPYATLDEYLDGDFWTVDRKEMFLIGAPSFDAGVAVKFSIELEDGTPVVTGEGRAVEYTAPSDEFPGGLKVRFRQLDADSKAVLRRALELRRKAYQAAMAEAAATESNAAAESADANAAQQAEAPPAAATNVAPRPEPTVVAAPAMAPVAAVLPNPPVVFAAASGAPSIGPDLLAMSVVPMRSPSALAAPPKARAASRHHAKVVSPPPNRDALLRRLRERARSLPAGRFRASQSR